MTPRQVLLQLQEAGSVLFHGSPIGDLATIEPRQATDTKYSRQIIDGEPAVSATPFADVAIFVALSPAIDQTKDISEYSQYGIKDGKPYLATTQATHDYMASPDTIGYVYILPKDAFREYEERGFEHRATKPIEPLKVVTVTGQDLPPSIHIRRPEEPLL